VSLYALQHHPNVSFASPPSGMLIATQANSRTAQACKMSISRGLEVSFASGAVMGNAVVGLGLFGLCIFYLAFTNGTPNSATSVGSDPTPSADGNSMCMTLSWTNFNRVFNRMAGFGFGASTIGMFARVGGGVFTKVRADARGASHRCLACSTPPLGLTWHIVSGLDLAGCRRRLGPSWQGRAGHP
jgi:Na+/H+-translocating membrane pyrophosphatase